MADMRSDTVTTPTDAMRAAMAAAVCGDDVFADDPTVIDLQNRAAALFGTEAALYVTSGTQGNLLAIMVHCAQRGSEIIVGDKSHIHVYEAGGSAAVAGVHSRTVTNTPNGELPLADIRSLIRPVDEHFPTTRLICLENTQNKCGGRVLTLEYMRSVRALADEAGLKVHLDGARLFNAIQVLGCTPAEAIKGCDSVQVCLSKGLGAPIGSLLLGSTEFIQQARRARKSLGGGWRQAGCIAAAGIVALTEMPAGLARDHANARKLADAMANMPGLSPAQVETNIVFCDVENSVYGESVEELVARLGEGGVRVLATGAQRFRAVTHHQVSDEGVDKMIAMLKKTE